MRWDRRVNPHPSLIYWFNDSSIKSISFQLLNYFDHRLIVWVIILEKISNISDYSFLHVNIFWFLYSYITDYFFGL